MAARHRRTGEGAPAGPEPAPGHNEVHLCGRVAAPAQERELPSGDRLTQLRLIVPREPGGTRRRRAGPDGVAGARAATVDTIDLVCWTARLRRSAARLAPGDHVEVSGALRRRFFGGQGGRQSRYEVEVTAIRRWSGRVSTET